MLERATACLDSGARLSVRCARRASRSNRSLGSTFWNHGAADLDLSPWAAPHNAQSPLDVHGSTQQSHRVAKKEQGERVDSTPVESPFLDFLYPPQALALLHRNGSHHAERWERRNERRLPKGFVQANRRYSSKAKRHQTTEDTMSTRDDVEGDLEPSRESVTSYAFTGETLDQLDRSTKSAQPKTSDAFESPDTSAETADIAAQIKRSKTLRSLIERPGKGKAFRERERSLEWTEYAWTLFEKSRPKDREDVALKIQLLEWLSYHRNEVAETHCLELYHTIPATRRTLTVYKSALPAFIRSDLYGLAEQGHAEALEHLENGHEVSVWLCSIAIKNEMWDLASRVKQQLDVKYGGHAQEWVENLFWSQIAETPKLLSKAINLSKHCRMLNQADATTAEFMRFSNSMFKVAIVKQFTISYVKSDGKLVVKKRESSRAEKTLNDGRIRYLIGRIQLTNADSPAFLQEIIHALIDRNSKVHYPDAHKTVSYIYRQHRSMQHASFRRNLLAPLMRKVVRYMDTPGSQWQQSWYISPTTLEQDWAKQFGRVDLWMHSWLMEYHAANGNVERLQYCYEGLLLDYPLHSDHKDILWTLVYVHARRGEVKQAVSAFETIQASATAAGDSLALRAWNVLLHAHSRADDIDGGLEVMKKLIASGHTPDKFSFHPVTELYASRGDVDSVLDLLEQYDNLTDSPRSTELYGSLMTAHINANDVESAYKVLEQLLPKVQAGEVKGYLTKCFNILLTGLALRREVDETMRVYQWMKDEQIEANNSTYAALMQALAAYRQTDAAWKILEESMPEKGLQPQAIHYSIVMTGFVRQHAFKTALDIHRKMISRNVKPTLSTNAIYLKARALYELRDGTKGNADLNDHPVELIIDELQEIFRDPAAGMAAHQPQTFSPMEDHSPQALLISQLIYVYGAAKSLEAVQTLVKAYTQAERKDGVSGATEPLPLRILTAVMPSYIQAHQWDEVGRCWNLAKEQADAIAISKPVPRFGSKSDIKASPEILKLSVAETTGQVAKPVSLLAKPKPEDPSRPAPALRHILSQPLRHHITALALQARFSEMISLVASILSQGYTLDNSTWNIFIEQLLRPSPPFALLAFRLTERYLIPSFPGWVQGKPYVNPSSHRQGLQYIRARYLSPDQLMPRYRTLVKLGAALLEIRRTDALGTTRKKARGSGDDKMSKYVGTMKEIKQHAPSTLYAVQSMPTVEDKLQTVLLRREVSST